MDKANIQVSQVHKRNDLNSCVDKFKMDLPCLTELERELICIPCGHWLSNDQIDYIISSIKLSSEA